MTVRSEWHTVKTTDGEMRAYLAATGSAQRASVIVLQEAFGVNAHIQSVANRFAAAGFLAIAPDLFHRSGVDVLEYEDRETAMSMIGALGVEEITIDVEAALGKAKAEAPTLRCGVVGFCFGGRAAFTSACTIESLDAAVSFYGPGVAAGPHACLDLVGDRTAPLLLLYGAEDPTISEQDRDTIERALEAAGVTHRDHVYEGAGHAFHCDARPPGFRPAAALDAWQQASGFLATHLDDTIGGR